MNMPVGCGMLLLLVAWRAAGAQTQAIEGPRVQETAPPPAITPGDSVPAAKADSAPRGPGEHRLSFLQRVLGVYDSNVDHASEALASSGIVTGLGLRLRSSVDRPAIELTYEIAHHEYNRTDRWDRISHSAELNVEVLRWHGVTLETRAQASLKGSSEDRELSNEYTARPELLIRFSSDHRIGLYGAYRLKRYPDESGRDAANRYLGAFFRERTGRHSRWELGYRYEINRAESTRYHYRRHTYSVEYDTPIGVRDRFTLEVKYRPQRYERTVEVEDEDVRREDHRLIVPVVWVHRLTSTLEFQLGYQFEGRVSNDPEKAYRSHVIAPSLTHVW